MSEIHRGLPHRSFQRPSGIAYAAVCRRSGLLPTENCANGRIYLPFLPGTIPSQRCDIHGGQSTFGGAGLLTSPSVLNDIDTSFLDDIPRIQLQWDLFPELNQQPTQQRREQNNRTPPPSVNNSSDDLMSNIPPVSNTDNNTRNEPAVVPNVSVQLSPRDDDDDYLPPWNQLN
jgi:hypothetical protein